jgi:hypothetical protein
MTLMRRGVTAALVVGSMAGGALGATVISAASGTAATTTTSTSNNAAPAGAPAGEAPSGGRFVPNENSTHEKGESAQREGQENAGQVPTVP